MAKAVPKTVDELIDLLTKSGLFDDTQRDGVRERISDCKDCDEALHRLTTSGRLTAWQSDQLRSGQFILKLGDYRLLSEAETWDFGRAFEAEHSTSGQRVSLKLLSSRFSQDEPLWKEFVADLRKVARLNDAHLTTFRDLAKTGGRQFLISDVEPAPTLEQRLAIWGTPGAAGQMAVLIQLAQALEALHGRELLHGCLTARRVRVLDSGEVRVGDIGLERLLKPLGDSAKTAAPLAPPADWPFYDRPIARDLFAVGQLMEKLRLSTPSRKSPPSWWSQDVTSEDARAALQRITVRLSATGSEPYASASELVNACRQWCQTFGVDLPAAAGLAQPPAPEKNNAKTAESKLKPPASANQSSTATSSATAEAPAIVINTEKRRKRRPAPAETSAAAAAAAAPRRKRGQFLIGSSVAAVLLILLIGIVSFLNSRRSDVAAADHRGAQAAKAQQNRAAEPKDDSLETNPDFNQSDVVAMTPVGASGTDLLGGSETNDSADPTLPDINASAFASAAAANSGAAQTTSEPATTDSTTTEQPADESTTVQPPSDTVPVAGNPDSETDSVASNTPTDAAATSTSPTVADATASSTTTSAPPDTTTPMPAADATATTATETMPPADNPYRELPSAVGLPDREKEAGADPVALAKIHVDDVIPCFLELIGGDRSGRGAQVLKIENAEGGTVDRVWDVLAVEGPGNRTVIGQFAIQGGQLLFHWTEKAKSSPLAPVLENCILQITINEQKAIVGLRLPILVDPLVLDLDKGITTDKWTIPNTPDVANCRFEILSFEGPFPKHTLFPPESIAAASGAQWVLFGEQKPDQVLALHVAASMRRSFQVTITSISQRGEDPVDGWVKDRSLRTIKAQRTLQLNGVRNEIQQLTAAVQRWDSLDETTLSEMDKQSKNLTKVKLERTTDLANKLQKLEDLCKALNDVGKVHFRVTYDVNGQALELLRTKGS